MPFPNMPKYFKQILILIFLVAILVLPYFVFAETTGSALQKLKSVGSGGGYAAATEYSFSGILGTVVSAALSLLGVIFIILMLYAGYNWMTASGDEQKIEKAKDTIWRAIIGIIIVVGSYAIWDFILTKFINK